MADIEVPHPGASDIVARLLSDALSEHPDVKWLGLVSEDGFAIASDGGKRLSIVPCRISVGAVMAASTRSGPAASAKSTTRGLKVVPFRACPRPARMDGLNVLPGRVAPTMSAFTHAVLIVSAL